MHDAASRLNLVETTGVTESSRQFDIGEVVDTYSVTEKAVA